MRALEFRAWDKNNKQMCYGGDCDAFLWDGYYNDPIGLVNDVLGDEHYIFEQYTGSKDKNGKKIYEGDIVKQVCQGEYPMDGCPVLIKWDNEGFGWSYFLNGCGLCRKMGWAEPNEVIVIGNLHENPELLEKGVE